MKTQKIKRYRLGVSRTFPKGHPRKGESTYFVEKIIDVILLIGTAKALNAEIVSELEEQKIHTIRANYELWAKRMEEVQAGRAVIELFYWEDKPRKSKQIVFATLDKDSGCGVQELSFNWGREGIRLLCYPVIDNRNYIEDIQRITINDGLSWQDFKAWFKNYDLSEPMAIIHFTSYRY